MTHTVKLEGYIERSGYKKAFIAKQLGITRYALILKINNKNEFKATEIDVLCELLKIGVKERMAIFFAKQVDLKSTTA